MLFMLGIGGFAVGGVAAGGEQGYLKLTLTLLGPGDEARLHQPDEEERTKG